MTETELKIKNLENQLIALKERQRVEAICKAIEKKATARDEAKKNEVDSLYDRFCDLSNKISFGYLSDCFMNIFDIVQTLQKNGFNVPSELPSSRIALEYHKHDNFYELSIINSRLSNDEGYFLLHIFDDEFDTIELRSWVIDAINRGVWSRGVKTEDKIHHLKQDIDLLEEFITNFDLFVEDLYRYAESV